MIASRAQGIQIASPCFTRFAMTINKVWYHREGNEAISFLMGCKIQYDCRVANVQERFYSWEIKWVRQTKQPL